jgi:hypothetical protein
MWNLILCGVGWFVALWESLTESAVEGMDHQWSPGHGGKECASRGEMQATAYEHEQENEQADHQSVVLKPFLHVASTPFIRLRLRASFDGYFDLMV